MADNEVQNLIQCLVSGAPGGAVFNPWRDVDPENDVGPEAPEIRRCHLQHFLSARLNTARLLLVGEAVGYQGGHFSGIAMTSERILLGHMKKRGLYPEHVLPNLTPQRTSRPEKMALGFTEPTATIVWGTLLHAGLSATDFILWNTFAWHPYNPQRGLLSNRKPTPTELDDSAEALSAFLRLFPGLQIVAVGNVAAETMEKFGQSHVRVRHPAQGGATRFREQIRSLVGETK